MADVSLSHTIAPPTVSTTEVQENFEALRDYANSSGWVDSDRLASGAVLANLGDSRGKSIIATEEARTNTAYGTLTTPDRVQNVVLPTDGLIFVAYQALWKESVASAARAALYLDENAVQAGDSSGGGPSGAGAETNHGVANTYGVLSSAGDGLYGAHTGGASGSYATTGTLVGVGGSLTDQVAGGPCIIFAAAGTYDVSVRFKASSGSVTAKERKLWVWMMGF